MITHRYSLWYIIQWFWYGFIQWIKFVVPEPILSPDPVSSRPPSWYTEVMPEWAWANCLDANRRPLSCWFENYRDAVFYQFGRWVEECGTWAKEKAQETVRAWIGWGRAGFSNLTDWSWWLERITGGFVPWFASNLADATIWLYRKLPPEIVNAWRSWSEIWNGIEANVRAWAHNTYDTFKNYALQARNWVLDQGNTLKSWWDNTHRWIDDLRDNLAQRVTGVLGSAWIALVTFQRDCLAFWYNLWSRHGPRLAEFLDDPLMWLYSRAEDWIIKYVW